ncbi:MAG: hypothetical protein GY789_28240 [Hyphomicrobiales bacterium]|nr:hypothetical protein [Hyphomicrobiales bacterium]MCP5000160.1 hypothetical protein [Hyphomicrobiales bacterium]
MTHETYSDLWNDESTDSFKADPPNAAIAIAGHETTDPLVVELLSAELNGKDLTYAVSVVSGDLPAEAKDIALFVDLFIVGGSGFGSK